MKYQDNIFMISIGLAVSIFIIVVASDIINDRNEKEAHVKFMKKCIIVHNANQCEAYYEYDVKPPFMKE